MSFFTVFQLTAGYGGNPVLEDISFSLEEGKILGILGANGSGKTTLLKSICGILPHGGQCVLENVSLESLSSRHLARLCSYIPQRSGITIDISVLDVVTMGFNPWLKLLQAPTAAMEEEARAALGRVGLEGMEQRSYLTLSEGQKQLCVLARTLAGPKRLLIMDEPESALDFRCRHRMLDILDHWRREAGRAAMVALHDPQLALNCCDEILLLGKGRSLGSFAPRNTPAEEMEGLLAEIYGPVSLHTVQSRGGKSRLIMLREGEDDL